MTDTIIIVAPILFTVLTAVGVAAVLGLCKERRKVDAPPAMSAVYTKTARTMAPVASPGQGIQDPEAGDGQTILRVRWASADGSEDMIESMTMVQPKGKAAGMDDVARNLPSVDGPDASGPALPMVADDQEHPKRRQTKVRRQIETHSLSAILDRVANSGGYSDLIAFSPAGDGSDPVPSQVLTHVAGRKRPPATDLNEARDLSESLSADCDSRASRSEGELKAKVSSLLLGAHM